jgi:hypothetical protein
MSGICQLNHKSRRQVVKPRHSQWLGAPGHQSPHAARFDPVRSAGQSLQSKQLDADGVGVRRDSDISVESGWLLTDQQSAVFFCALHLEVDGAPTLGASSSMAVGGTSTLRFKPTSGSASVASGVTSSVASGATLELAGTVSALSSGPNRVNITNNSSSAGVLVSGTNQQVGNIDGSGTTQVNAGSDLTANHIIQSALVIGGVMGNSAIVTIAASDSSGNPLGESGVVPTRMSVASADGQEPVLSAGVSSSSRLLPPSGGVLGGDPLPVPADSSPAGGVAAVPEPATILLLALGGLALTCRARAQLPARRCAQVRPQ